jgi:gas vesicle protein
VARRAGGRPATGPAVEDAARAGATVEWHTSCTDFCPTDEEDDMADEVPTRVRSIVERVLEADVTDQIARRGQELAEAVGQATESVSQRAGEAWKDTAAQRRDAEKTARRVGRDALKWGRRTWQREVRPNLRDLWSRRGAAIAAAGAAVPASRGLVDDAALRLGIKRREERHWTAFFIGLLLGAIAGAVIAILTTPKPGREMRNELAGRARDAADKAREAAGANDWVPLFQRPAEGAEPESTSPDSASLESGNGHPAPSAATELPPEPAPSEPATAADNGGEAEQPS